MHAHTVTYADAVWYTLITAALMLGAGAVFVYTPGHTMYIAATVVVTAYLLMSGRKVAGRTPWTVLLFFQVVFGVLFGLLGVLLAGPCAIIGRALAERLVHGGGVRSVV